MKNRIIILSLCASCLLAIVAFVYNSETKTDPLALSPIVAKRVTTPTGTLVSCNLKALKDTVDIPLSYLTEELQVVKLDNRDEALVGGWIRTTVGEKYILVSNNKQTPYKLFTRDGKFITTIGAYGQGPNEYGNTYADQLDEAHNRIYILPWQSDKLLVFDLQGNPQPPIPLCMRVPKGKFRVDTEKSEVTLTTLPFEGWPAVVWTQDFKGKRKNFIAPGHLTVPRDFSNEVFMDNNTNDYGVMLMVIMPAHERTVCTTITQPKIDSKPDSPWNIRTRRKSPGTAIPNTHVTLLETFPCRYKYQKTLGAAANLPSIS